MSRHEWDKLGRLWQKLEEHAAKFSDLSMLQVLSPLPLPAGHPDIDDFDGDLADMHKLARRSLKAAETVNERHWHPGDIATHAADNNSTTIHHRMVLEHNDKGRMSPETAMLAEFLSFRDLGVRIRQWA